jgi:hypothetical protein
MRFFARLVFRHSREETKGQKVARQVFSILSNSGAKSTFFQTVDFEASTLRQSARNRFSNASESLLSEKVPLKKRSKDHIPIKTLLRTVLRSIFPEISSKKPFDGPTFQKMPPKNGSTERLSGKYVQKIVRRSIYSRNILLRTVFFPFRGRIWNFERF